MAIKIKRKRKRQRSDHFTQPTPTDDPRAWAQANDAVIREAMKAQVPARLSMKLEYFEAYAAGIYVGECTGYDQDAAAAYRRATMVGQQPYEAAQVVVSQWAERVALEGESKPVD